MKGCSKVCDNTPLYLGSLAECLSSGIFSPLPLERVLKVVEERQCVQSPTGQKASRGYSWLFSQSSHVWAGGGGGENRLASSIFYSGAQSISTKKARSLLPLSPLFRSERLCKEPAGSPDTGSISLGRAKGQLFIHEEHLAVSITATVSLTLLRHWSGPWSPGLAPALPVVCRVPAAL